MPRLKNYLFLVACLLAACGTQVKTPTATPPASLTPINTPTETPIPTNTPIPEPGTTIISPEYNLEGQVEIIPDNGKAFHEYFINALFLTNPTYFNDLGISDLPGLKTYLKAHDWILPAGVKLPITGPDRTYLKLGATKRDISLKNLSIEIITAKQYEELQTSNPDLFSSFFTAFDGEKSNAVLLGFALRKSDQGDFDTVSIQVVNTKLMPDVGFPSTDGGLLLESDLQLLNFELMENLYLQRIFATIPEPAQMTQYSPDRGGWDYLINVNKTTGVARDIYLTKDIGEYFINDFMNQNPTDAPPIILKRGK